LAIVGATFTVALFVLRVCGQEMANSIFSGKIGGSMLVYLDNCCYNRPFDDQSNLLVRIETETKMQIQEIKTVNPVDFIRKELI
jgi:hypothetical protein